MRARIDFFLLVGLAAAAGACACTAPLVAGASTLVALLFLFFVRGGARWSALVATLAFVAGAWRAERVVARYDAARARSVEVAPGTWPARCAIRGEVVRSPVVMGGALRVDVDVGVSDCGFAGRATLHVPFEDAPILARGDEVGAVAQLAPIYVFWNDPAADPRVAAARRGTLVSGGGADVRIVAAGRGVRAGVDRARAELRARITATFPADTEALARALVLGEDDLAAEDGAAFRKSGLAHLLAVSGMHLVLVVATLVAALRALFVRVPWIAARIAPIRAAAAIGAPIAWLYADLAGGSGSAIRAAWMTSVALIAHAIGRRPDTRRAFGISVAGMIVLDPLASYDVSFVLSAAATGGLLAIGPAAARFFGERLRLPSLVARPLAASAAASIACAPILACITPDLPLAGLLANLVAVPLGELAALPLCLLHGVLSPLPVAERGCALAASGALGLVRAVAHYAAAAPGASLPVPVPTSAELAALALGAFFALHRRPRLTVAALSACVLLEVVAVRPRSSSKLTVTFLDVGQGGAALVDFPDGTTMLIDGGGLVGSPVDVGERVIAPFLRARRAHGVDVMVLTHPHPDHFGGLGRVTAGELWDTGQGEIEGTGGLYAALLATSRARGARVRRPDTLCGRHAIGGAVVEVLAPCPGPTSDRGPNDNSLVIRVRYGERAFLFTGDAERAEELDLPPSSLRADVLKVGHHGSRTSTSPAFAAAVAPSVAVISCGVRNRFGHPHATTLATLGLAGARVLRTDRDGAVVVSTDGASLDVSTASTSFGR